MSRPEDRSGAERIKEIAVPEAFVALAAGTSLLDALHFLPFPSVSFQPMLAVCAPEYFPRLEYMALVQHVDDFVLADTFRYRRASFHARSKLRHAEGWHWIDIPLFGRPEGAPIQGVEIETGGRWREKHWRSFMYDYRTTMYFEYFEEDFRPFFEQKWERLGPCTCRSVELQAELFGLDTDLHRASDLEGAPNTVAEVVEVLGAETLVVRADTSVPDVGGVTVETFSYEHPAYRQNFEGFEPGMTAADLVFNYGREAQRHLAQGVASSTAA